MLGHIRILYLCNVVKEKNDDSHYFLMFLLQTSVNELAVRDILLKYKSAPSLVTLMT